MNTKLISIVLMLIMSISTNAQTFKCEKIQSDFDAIEKYKNSNFTKWANSVLENGLYKPNADGSYEYVYILNSTDSFNISTLRKIAFDFIEYTFHTDNAQRSDMEINSPKDGVIFKGYLNRVGSFVGFDGVNVINAAIHYDIRCKSNRIRLAIKIQDYQVIKTVGSSIVENRLVHVNKCFPLNSDSDHKKSYAMAFVKSNKGCVRDAISFLDFLNKHITENQPTNVEDW